jgi:hypothetical protein
MWLIPEVGKSCSESIGQYGPGYRSATYNDFRGKLTDRAVERTTKIRKIHEDSWKENDCSIMSDGWTSINHRHIINFLANSPAGTFLPWISGHFK